VNKVFGSRVMQHPHAIGWMPKQAVLQCWHWLLSYSIHLMATG